MNTSTTEIKVTSHCYNCFHPVRWQVKQTDPLLNTECCSECAPWAKRLVDATHTISDAEEALANCESRKDAHSRAIRLINKERIIDGDIDRRAAKDKLSAIKQRRKKELADAATNNGFLSLSHVS